MVSKAVNELSKKFLVQSEHQDEPADKHVQLEIEQDSEPVQIAAGNLNLQKATPEKNPFVKPKEKTI